MSLHELYTLYLGGTEEHDDAYEDQRDHLYTISEHRI